MIDLAFYLGGKPSEISTYSTGGLSWHPSSSIFSGSGISDKGALFSYKANWESAGRWSLEILTKKNKYLFEPLEKIKVQNKGSVLLNEIKINDQLDVDFKPGLYLQTDSFLKGLFDELCSFEEQFNMLETYKENS